MSKVNWDFFDEDGKPKEVKPSVHYCTGCNNILTLDKYNQTCVNCGAYYGNIDPSTLPREAPPLPLAVVFLSSPERWTPRYSAKILIIGQRDDIRMDGFKSEDETWKAIEAKYSQFERIATHGEYIERRRQNLKELGTDFEGQSSLWR